LKFFLETKTWAKKVKFAECPILPHFVLQLDEFVSNRKKLFLLLKWLTLIRSEVSFILDVGG